MKGRRSLLIWSVPTYAKGWPSFRSNHWQVLGLRYERYFISLSGLNITGNAQIARDTATSSLGSRYDLGPGARHVQSVTSCSNEVDPTRIALRKPITACRRQSTPDSRAIATAPSPSTAIPLPAQPSHHFVVKILLLLDPVLPADVPIHHLPQPLRHRLPHRRV
jgi:hypothetical protein